MPALQFARSDRPVESILLIPTRLELWAARRWLRGSRRDPPEGSWPAGVRGWQTGKTLVLEMGMGPAASRRLIPHLEALAPGRIWLLGWCGAVHPGLKCGDIVVSSTVLPEEGGELATSVPAGLLSCIGKPVGGPTTRTWTGPVASRSAVVYGIAEKRLLEPALAVEMEAGPIAIWSAGQPLELVQVRVVLDDLKRPLPGGAAGGWKNFGRQMLACLFWPAAVWRANGRLYRLLEQLERGGYLFSDGER